MDIPNTESQMTEIDIVYSPCSCWGVDLADMRKLFLLAQTKIAESIGVKKPIKCATPCEAEAVWFVARCRKLSIRFGREIENGKLQLLTKNDFWRIFTTPLRELDLMRFNIEEWEQDMENVDNPVDSLLSEEEE